jgi:hypothetical protein
MTAFNVHDTEGVNPNIIRLRPTLGAYCLLAHSQACFSYKARLYCWYVANVSDASFAQRRSEKHARKGSTRPIKREESPQELRFVVVNDPTHDFDLTQEAIIGNEIVAVIYETGPSHP